MARLVFGLAGVGRVEAVESGEKRGPGPGEKRGPGRPPGSKKKALQQITASAADIDSEVPRICIASS